MSLNICDPVSIRGIENPNTTVCWIHHLFVTKYSHLLILHERLKYFSLELALQTKIQRLHPLPATVWEIKWEIVRYRSQTLPCTHINLNKFTQWPCSVHPKTSSHQPQYLITTGRMSPPRALPPSVSHAHVPPFRFAPVWSSSSPGWTGVNVPWSGPIATKRKSRSYQSLSRRPNVTLLAHGRRLVAHGRALLFSFPRELICPPWLSFFFAVPPSNAFYF